MINWTCRQCGEELEAPESQDENAIDCPKCGVRQLPGSTVAPESKSRLQAVSQLDAKVQAVSRLDTKNKKIIAAVIGVIVLIFWGFGVAENRRDQREFQRSLDEATESAEQSLQEQLRKTRFPDD